MGNTSSMLTQYDIEEVQSHCHDLYEQQEILSLYQRFCQLDRNAKGFISADEFLSVPEFAMNPLSQGLLKMVDGLNFKDFVAFLSAFSAKASLRQKVQLIFKVYDSDCNGKVSFKDIMEVLRDLSGSFMSDQQREQVLSQVLKESGYTSDSFLTLEDFITATSGLGKAIAFKLSKKGFYVVLVGRSSHLLSKTVNEIKRQIEDAQLKAFEVDMSSFQSVLKFGNSLEQWLLESDLHSSIQLLVNNAGILATSSRPTVEGFDRMIATNYVGAFSLTKLLLSLLRNSPMPSRVVNVTSFTHRSAFAGRFDMDSITGVNFSRLKQYPCVRIYEYSKLCLLLFSYELHRQLHLMDDSHHISVVAIDPGAVKTNIMHELPSYIQVMVFCCLKILRLMQSPENAAESVIDAAFAPPEKSGKYFFGGNSKTIESSSLSRDPKLAKELWDTSCLIFNELQQTYTG